MARKRSKPEAISLLLLLGNQVRSVGWHHRPA